MLMSNLTMMSRSSTRNSCVAKHPLMTITYCCKLACAKRNDPTNVFQPGWLFNLLQTTSVRAICMSIPVMSTCLPEAWMTRVSAPATPPFAPLSTNAPRTLVACSWLLTDRRWTWGGGWPTPLHTWWWCKNASVLVAIGRPRSREADDAEMLLSVFSVVRMMGAWEIVPWFAVRTYLRAMCPPCLR